MNVVTVKHPADLEATVASEARHRIVTRSARVRQIIGNALIRNADAVSPSCSILVRELVGAIRSGLSDLATNRRLLDETITRDTHRVAADRCR